MNTTLSPAPEDSIVISTISPEASVPVTGNRIIHLGFEVRFVVLGYLRVNTVTVTGDIARRTDLHNKMAKFKF